MAPQFSPFLILFVDFTPIKADLKLASNQPACATYFPRIRQSQMIKSKNQMEGKIAEILDQWLILYAGKRPLIKILMFT
jgi:hypothetical protein